MFLTECSSLSLTLMSRSHCSIGLLSNIRWQGRLRVVVVHSCLIPNLYILLLLYPTLLHQVPKVFIDAPKNFRKFSAFFESRDAPLLGAEPRGRTAVASSGTQGAARPNPIGIYCNLMRGPEPDDPRRAQALGPWDDPDDPDARPPVKTAD
jgi:hypothetical protein